jgi:hypothetical protein
MQGLVHYHAQQALLPPDERYLHAVMQKGDIQIAVTMNPVIAELIHDLRSLQIDFTFKHVSGDLKDWDVVGFHDALQLRMIHRLSI